MLIDVKIDVRILSRSGRSCVAVDSSSLTFDVETDFHMSRPIAWEILVACLGSYSSVVAQLHRSLQECCKFNVLRLEHESCSQLHLVSFLHDIF